MTHHPEFIRRGHDIDQGTFELLYHGLLQSGGPAC